MSGTAAGPSPQRISLLQLALLLPWVVIVIDVLDMITDNSFLWHITAGDLQRHAGEVLTTDPFSFTVQGEHWLTQSWLAELAYSLGDQVWGISFAGPMLILAWLITIVSIGVIAHRKSASLLATVVVVMLSTVLMLPFLVPRPAFLSYPLFALVILSWDRPATRWAVPFLIWIWASAHGSFAIGLAYLVLVVVMNREWKASVQVLAAGIATLLTAHGLGAITMLVDFISAQPYLDLMSEWRTPDFVTPRLAPFLIGVLLLIHGAAKGRINSRSLWVIGPFLALGMTASRAVLSAWIGLTPLVAMSLTGAKMKWGRGFPRPIAAGFVVVMLALPFLLAKPVVIDEEGFPVAAAAELEDVRTFHDDHAGGYLIYAEQFTEGVYIDDRAELYRERIEEFVEVRAGEEPWEPVFERDGIQQALLRVGQPMIDDLTAAGWETSYEDEFFVVLVPPS